VAEAVREELEQLVLQHINSPSIIMWVPLNEGWGQDARKKEDGTIGKAPYDKPGTIALADKVKKWDPTRLVNNASAGRTAAAATFTTSTTIPAPPRRRLRSSVRSCSVSLAGSVCRSRGTSGSRTRTGGIRT
jgi:beta-galactosidase/beta-glucuronidase